jgi:hypothetical protein
MLLCDICLVFFTNQEHNEGAAAAIENINQKYINYVSITLNLS